MDNLINCPRCESDACYVDEVNQDIKSYLCYGCGFQTNSLMKKDEEFYNEQLLSLPELYKDLIYTDENKLNWFPSAVNVPNQGMVFANGSSQSDWKWSAVKAVPVTEEEKTKYPIPGKEGKYYDWRMDMTTISSYSERDYMDALDYIGVFEK